jgi:hypothetical protein
MKNFIKISIIILLTLFLSGASGAVQENSKPVLSKILVGEQLKSYKIPGFLARYALLITEDTRKLRPMFKGVSSISVSVAEDLKDSNRVFNRINSQLSSNNYTSILEVVDSESSIVVKLLEQNDTIRELVFMINDNSSFICISLKGRISTENLLNVVSTLMAYSPNA